MAVIDRHRVLRAMDTNPWEFSNQVLYDLCAANPTHEKESVVIAKILLIGRVYAAAIERRKNKRKGEGTDNFYVDTVAPMLMKSEIDRWIAEARASRPGTPSALRTLVKVHRDTTALFQKIPFYQQFLNKHGDGRVRLATCSRHVSVGRANGSGAGLFQLLRFETSATPRSTSFGTGIIAPRASMTPCRTASWI